MARARCGSDRARDLATSYESSTRESAVFTLWPPGPLARENRHDSSSAGTVIGPARSDKSTSSTLPQPP